MLFLTCNVVIGTHWESLPVINNQFSESEQVLKKITAVVSAPMHDIMNIYVSHASLDQPGTLH